MTTKNKKTPPRKMYWSMARELLNFATDSELLVLQDQVAKELKTRSERFIAKKIEKPAKKALRNRAHKAAKKENERRASAQAQIDAIIGAKDV